jgi:hypothetical protein
LAASGDNISTRATSSSAPEHCSPSTATRVQRVVLREVYPRYLSGKVQDRKGRPINPVREATIDRYVLPELEAEFSALIERFDRSVESGVWTPAPGTHCSYCPRPEACTIFPSARQEGRITSPEEAERVAGRLTVLDAMRTQATKALRPWSNHHGDVPIRGAKTPKVYGPVVRQRTLSPDAEAVAAHVARGGRPQDLYRTEDYVTFCVHSPDEIHPHAAAARREERRCWRCSARRRNGGPDGDHRSGGMRPCGARMPLREAFTTEALLASALGPRLRALRGRARAAGRSARTWRRRSRRSARCSARTRRLGREALCAAQIESGDRSGVAGPQPRACAGRAGA